jgi:outer membrane lipoprotein-sorting protein
MKTLAVITLCACLFLNVQVQAKTQSEKEACQKVKDKIEAIQSRMRTGYSASQGRRYEERLRELRDKRYRLCR